MKTLSLSLHKFLSGLNKKPDSQPTRSPATKIAVAKKPVETPPAMTQPQHPPSPSGIEILDSLTKFLRRHLVCDDYQFTLLALWIVHTWCFRCFPTTAYLHIRSAQSQSGKTLCLKLFSALCDSPLLIPGGHWRSILDNLLTPDRRLIPHKPVVRSAPRTILLDDCHHTFAPSERQRILGLLNTGSQADCAYIDGLKRYSVFGPKAFAGNAALPSSLSSRCIPIVLRRKKPVDSVVRFNPDAAVSLARSLESWAVANATALATVGRQSPANLPPGLSARQQDCAESLLHLAQRIGGPWPDRARFALVAAFKLSEDSLSLELLGDIRGVFYLKEDPAHLSTRDLIAGLQVGEHRPWADWKHGSTSGRRLSALLKPFSIRSRDFTKGSAPTFKGYLRESFLDAWERYLPPIPDDWPQIRAQMKKDAEAASKN